MRKSINQSKRDCIRPKIAAPEKAPPRAREKNMLAPPLPPTIYEESSDCPPLSGEVSNGAASSSNVLPHAEPIGTPMASREQVIAALRNTAQDDGSFQADRMRAAQYLQEDGVVAGDTIDPTPKRFSLRSFLFLSCLLGLTCIKDVSYERLTMRLSSSAYFPTSGPSSGVSRLSDAMALWYRNMGDREVPPDPSLNSFVSGRWA